MSRDNNKRLYRVWWIPQIPGKPFFTVEVATLAEAQLLTRTLADYDRFQFQHHIKPDYSNAGGIEMREVGGEWEEVEDAELEAGRAP